MKGVEGRREVQARKVKSFHKVEKKNLPRKTNNNAQKAAYIVTYFCF